MDSENIGIIILAAGSSTRMGQSKQLLVLEGEPLLVRSIRTALDTQLKNIVVVLGYEAEKHLTIIGDLPVQCISNESWSNGMGSSLKVGLTQLVNQHPKTEASIIMVCDQPDVTTQHLHHLILSFKQSDHSIVASKYEGTSGVPVLFPRNHFQEILMMDDAQGAKKILEKNQANVITIHFPQGATDLDTPADVERYVRNK